MATIRPFWLLAQLRSDPSSHIIRYANGQIKRSGRGLVFWFRPETASIAEIPMDDREMTLFVKGRSQDFQAVAVQGSMSWHVIEPQKLAERVDFTINLANGRPQGEPLERIESRLTGIANQIMLHALAQAPVRTLLDAGPEPLRLSLESALRNDPALAEMGLAAGEVRLTNLAPSSELERALQTPTFEALQQKADQATFERRALAVEKERAIAENELANRTELARREKQLIAEDADNARHRALGIAEASQIEAQAEADRIRTVEGAKADAERQQIAIYRDLPPSILLGLAAQQLAGKLETIEHVTITPDLLATVLGAFNKGPALTDR